MITVRAVIEEVARATNISPHELASARRGRQTARARTATYWLARQMTPQTLSVIGRTIGGRDHTTICQGLARAEHLRAEDAEFRALTDRLLSTLGGAVSEYERGYCEGLAAGRAENLCRVESATPTGAHIRKAVSTQERTA